MSIIDKLKGKKKPEDVGKKIAAAPEPKKARIAAMAEALPEEQKAELLFLFCPLSVLLPLPVISQHRRP